MPYHMFRVLACGNLWPISELARHISGLSDDVGQAAAVITTFTLLLGGISLHNLVHLGLELGRG